MRENELRIGNWVELDKDYYQIERTIFAYFSKDALDNISPIPLTEQWLKDFGFDEHKALLITSHSINISDYPSEYKVISISIEAGNQYVYLRNGETMGKREDDVVVVVFNGDSKGKLFVHHIQNLYFALTGKELTK